MHTYPFKLPNFTLPYDVCSPLISKKAMKIHHQKHHKSYVDKLNELIANDEFLSELSLDMLIKKENLDKIDETTSEKVRNFGGGHFNHLLFFSLLTNKKSSPGKMFMDLIKKDFGDFNEFLNEFKEKSNNHFGSGWCWATIRDSGLEIKTTKNQDTPVNYEKCKPILGIDLWEHVYYLDYQNRKKEYIDGIFDYINWKQVENYILEAENE